MPHPVYNWRSGAIGLAVALALVTTLWLAARRQPAPAGRRDDGYAPQIAITGAQVAEAQSMMAGGVVYYSGNIENRGARTLTGYTVSLTFRDVDGKPLERDQRVLLDDRLRPIPPHSVRGFEIGFDKIPSGWNQAPPSPEATAVYTR